MPQSAPKLEYSLDFRENNFSFHFSLLLFLLLAFSSKLSGPGMKYIVVCSHAPSQAWLAGRLKWAGLAGWAGREKGGLLYPQRQVRYCTSSSPCQSVRPSVRLSVRSIAQSHFLHHYVSYRTVQLLNVLDWMYFKLPKNILVQKNCQLEFRTKIFKDEMMIFSIE